MDIQFFLVPAVGGVIGYFTNWLAIKMLFLPRTEKRIFGMRVPLTPGVLPKSQKRMASKIGETVGDYLLTEETIKEAILSADMNSSLEEMLDSLYERLKNTDKSLGDVLDAAFGGASVDRLKEGLLSAIDDTVLNEEKRKKITDYISGMILELVKNMDIQLYLDKAFDYMLLLADEKGPAYLEEEAFEELMKGLAQRTAAGILAEERPVSSLISAEAVESLKGLFLLKMPEITAGLEKLLQENEALNEKLMALTKKVVDESVGQFFGGLVYKKVFESIKEGAVAFIADEENMAQISEKLFHYLDIALEKNVCYYGERLVKLYNENEDHTGELVYNLFKNIDFTVGVKKFLDYVRQKLNEVLKNRSLYGIMLGINPQFKTWLDGSVDQLLLHLCDGLRAGGIDQCTDFLLEKIQGVEIKKIVGSAGRKPYMALKNKVFQNEELILGKISEVVVTKLRVPEIVETKINDMEVKEMENLVLYVAKKELRYITYMGGVLGLIIGFVPQIASYFM